MPRTEVVFYAEDDGTCPLLDWMDGLPQKAQDKCIVRIERLGEMGHELRRPEADFLRVTFMNYGSLCKASNIECCIFLVETKP